MLEQENKPPSLPQRPTADDRNAWHTYWQKLGQSWRTEPEIDAERQMYLAERLRIIPNIEQRIYPFKDIKLYRADIEWLLATHEEGRGTIDWSDERQRERLGLDLSGAILIKADLYHLHRAWIRFYLSSMYYFNPTTQHR